MKQIRKRLTYANVMSSIAVFLVLGGATAIAAQKIGKNDLKANAVTAAKIKRNAVTAAKIRNNAVTTNKIRNEAVTGDKVNEASLGTVPNSTTTDEVVSTKGTLSLGQATTILEYAGVKLVVNCEAFEPGATPEITARAYIESAVEGTTFLSWLDAHKSIGPGTLHTDREVTSPFWGASSGPMRGEAGAPIDVTTSAGPSYAGHIGVASEKDSNTCWYWLHGTIFS